jgi:hypothetical protein
MKAVRVYLVGVSLIALAGLVIGFVVPPAFRNASIASVLIGLLVQGPLGWWLIRSVGTQRFLGVWVIGMLARFGILGIMALLVFPLFHWPISPGLLVLGGVLVALLFLEGLVVWLQHTRVEAR